MSGDVRRAPARYFPVSPGPLRMQAGLLRFGVDLGNGPVDGSYFQVDERLEETLAAKRAAPAERYASLAPRDARAERAALAALAWMRGTLASEHPERLQAAAADTAARDPFDALGRAVQEDFAVLDRGDGGAGRLVLLHVCFPSGWRPDRLAGADFAAIHGPVPGFAKPDAAARSMVSAMIDRGPYVRFVWTLSADPWLDHHPESGRRARWPEAPMPRESPCFLRVERQVTVPLADADASVFLIRTYVEPVAALAPAQRTVLAEALAAMPEEVRRYKGLPHVDIVAPVLA
jgi:hypothetical protein